MNLPALLRYLFFLTTTQPTNTGNTTTSNPPILLLPRQGFTDPNLPTQPITFYETASAIVISNGKTYTTTYVDLISGTTEFPVTVGSSGSSSSSSSTGGGVGTTLVGKPTITTTTTSSTSTGGVGSSISTTALASTESSSLLSAIRTTTPTPSSSTSPSASPSITSLTTLSSTSPVLDLAPCSTFTGAESLLEGCINSVVGALSLTGGGPIIASTSSSSSTSTSSTAPASTTAPVTTSTAAATTVTPTTTITMPYLGAVVAKGEATFAFGGEGVVKEGKGVRGRGRRGEWGLVLGWVGAWVVVGFLRL